MMHQLPSRSQELSPIPRTVTNPTHKAPAYSDPYGEFFQKVVSRLVSSYPPVQTIKDWTQFDFFAISKWPGDEATAKQLLQKD